MKNVHYVLLSGPKPLFYTKLHTYYNCSEGKVCLYEPGPEGDTEE